MLVLSFYIPHLMAEDDPTAHVDILTLTVVFFMLNFLAATQDIAVDGWALTMLSRYVTLLCNHACIFVFTLHSWHL